MSKEQPKVPLAPIDRIQALDVLRGFALLGILIMNIQSFSMIGAAYMNPSAFGDLSGRNLWVWIISHVLADQKFLSIFSMLFGAGVVLFTERLEARGQSAASVHYRRMFYLILFGLLHAHLLWYGDILVTYGLCALAIYLMRRLSPGKLLIIGIAVFSVASLLSLFFGSMTPHMTPADLKEMAADWRPDPTRIEREIAAYQGGWAAQMSHRVPMALKFETFIFLVFLGWRAGGLMLVGMALFKWGVLSAERSRRFYAALASLGFGIGLPAVLCGVHLNFAANWSLEFSMFYGNQFNYWGSVFVAAGYVGAVMLVCKSETLGRFTRPLAAIGRTALTNYLLQSIIATAIFYGHGLGLYGRVERTGQILIVFGIWILQLVASSLWLRHFRFGPFEWLWRSLTYMSRQPLRV